MRALPPEAELGRFRATSFCRENAAPLFVGRFEAGLGEEFPNRPEVSPLVSIWWTRMSDAPLAGAVRAITERFCMDIGGRATFPRA